MAHARTYVNLVRMRRVNILLSKEATKDDCLHKGKGNTIKSRLKPVRIISENGGDIFLKIT